MMEAVEVQKQSIWRNRNFVILFLTGAILAVGNKVYELALPLILYEATHSSVAMAGMRAVEFLPNLLLALFMGVFVDRSNKKRWTQGVVLGQTAILFVLVLWHRFGGVPLSAYYVAAFVLMACGYGYNNARMSIVKITVPTELFTAANANFSFVSTLIGILGPALTGLILLFSDLHDGLLVTAIAYAVSYGAVAFLQTKEGPRVHATQSFWADLQEGWRELRHNRPLWLITVLVIFLNSASGMFDSMVIFFAKDHLQLDSSQLGLVLASTGLGGLLGSRCIVWARKRFPTGRLLAGTMFLTGISYLVMFAAQDAVMMAIALFFTGLFTTIESVCIWTFRQESTPTHLIGRISGLTGSLFKLGMPFAIFGSGFAAEVFGPSTVFLGAALCNLLIVVFYLRSPLWKLP